MLECLEVENFQKHESRRVHLAHPITTITGPTDSGKSSLLRLLKWILCNVPQGDGYVKIGEEEAVGTLVIDGRTIERVRGKNDNLYVLDGKEFRAFGSSVPDEISKLANVGPTNFQGQFDSVFWFSQTAGEVSRQLNAVVDLGIIDETIENITHKVRQLQSESKVTKGRLDKAKDELSALEWVVDADDDYRDVERLKEMAELAATRRASLLECVERIAIAEKTRHTANTAASDCRKVGLLGVAAKTAADRVESLATSVHLLKRSEEVVGRGFPDVSSIDELYVGIVSHLGKSKRLSDLIVAIKLNTDFVNRGVPDVSKLTELKEKFEISRDKSKRLKGSIGVIIDGEDEITELKELQSRTETELHEACQGLCPICGKEMSDVG